MVLYAFGSCYNLNHTSYYNLNLLFDNTIFFTDPTLDSCYNSNSVLTAIWVYVTNSIMHRLRITSWLTSRWTPDTTWSQFIADPKIGVMREVTWLKTDLTYFWHHLDITYYLVYLLSCRPNCRVMSMATNGSILTSLLKSKVCLLLILTVRPYLIMHLNVDIFLNATIIWQCVSKGYLSLMPIFLFTWKSKNCNDISINESMNFILTLILRFLIHKIFPSNLQ